MQVYFLIVIRGLVNYVLHKSTIDTDRPWIYKSRMKGKGWRQLGGRTERKSERKGRTIAIPGWNLGYATDLRLWRCFYCLCIGQVDATDQSGAMIPVPVVFLSSCTHTLLASNMTSLINELFIDYVCQLLLQMIVSLQACMVLYFIVL